LGQAEIWIFAPLCSSPHILVLCEMKQFSIMFGTGLQKYFYSFSFLLGLPIWKKQNSVKLLLDLNPWYIFGYFFCGPLTAVYKCNMEKRFFNLLRSNLLCWPYEWIFP
jgi:hypothetical protein